MLYGSELWGYNNTECLEVVQRKFLKYALKLKTGTSTAFLYCETGYLAIETEIKIKIVSFWVNLLIGRRVGNAGYPTFWESRVTGKVGYGYYPRVYPYPKTRVRVRVIPVPVPDHS